MKDLAIFKNEAFGEVRVAGTSEQPLFCLADICRVLEIRNPSDCKSRLDQRGVVLTEGVSKTTNQYGVTTEQKVMLTFISEKNLYKVIMRSDKPQAEAFQDWVCGEVLPAIRKSGSYAINSHPVKVSEKMQVATWLIKTLKLNDCSKLMIAKSIADPYGLPLPDYTPSKGVLKSATELLKEHGMNITASTFNIQAENAGYLSTQIRPSSGGKVKKFKSITEKGKPYGENQVSPHSPKETQPLWYADKFGELLGKLGVSQLKGKEGQS